MPDPEQMRTLIMGRRSTRHYKQKNVAPDLISQLLEAAAHAPTAVNRRDLRFTVVGDMDSMETIRQQTTKAALAVIRENRSPKGMEWIANYLLDCEQGIDVIFRNAPHLVVVSAPSTALAAMADGHIALSYFELLANTHGIGTVWNGIARAVFTSFTPELCEKLGIPEGHQLICAMSFGFPAVKYHRTVQRASNIHWAEIK